MVAKRFEKLKTWLTDNTGATAVEYGLIAALLTIAIIGSLSQTAQESTDTWNTVIDAQEAAFEASAGG